MTKRLSTFSLRENDLSGRLSQPNSQGLFVKLPNAFSSSFSKSYPQGQKKNENEIPFNIITQG